MADKSNNNGDEAAKGWLVDGIPPEESDPLLQCLITVTKLYNRPVSAKTLCFGLPLEYGLLTPKVFPRAAKRAQLDCLIVKKKLEEINEIAFPCILLLKNKQACVLVGQEKNGNYVIIRPELNSKKIQVAPSVLEKEYKGHAFYLSKHQKYEHKETKSSKSEAHWFWGAIESCKSIYTEAIVASFLINIFSLAMPLFIMNVYDRVVPNNAFNTLWVLAIGVSLIIAFDYLIRALRGYFIDIAGKNIDTKLSASIFEQLLGLRMGSRPQSIGTLANTVYAFDSLRDLITSTSVTVFIDLPFAVLYILVIWYIGGSLALIPLIAIPLIIWIAVMIQKPLEKKISQMYNVAGERQTTLIETLNGAENIKVIGAESAVQSKWEDIVCRSSKIAVEVHFLSNVAGNLSIIWQYLTTLMLIIVGVYMIAAGDITIGALIAATILNSRAIAPVAPAVSLLTRCYQSALVLKNIDQLMREDIDRPNSKNYLRREILNGNIEYKNISFKYPTQPYKNIKDISFKINAGEKVGIVGRVGSGKSTILKLIAGLYDVEQGNILFDGTDHRQIDPADLRRNIGFVPQDIMLFAGSIRENIAYAAPYVNDENILKAAKVSTVEQYTSLHPDGLDWQIGEKGELISGGQRQAIAIARALLLDPNIILMDEPTNAMDSMTEKKFMMDFNHACKEKTIIIVSHRASALEMVDRLIVINNGEVVGDGPKDTILKKLYSKN